MFGGTYVVLAKIGENGLLVYDFSFSDHFFANNISARGCLESVFYTKSSWAKHYQKYSNISLYIYIVFCFRETAF